MGKRHRRAGARAGRARLARLMLLLVAAALVVLSPYTHYGDGESFNNQAPLFSPELRKSLVARWPLDEGAGRWAADATGHGHDGELRNGPTWVEGVLGNALRFDGVDDYVFVAYAPDFAVTRGLTFALWAYLEREPDETEGNDWRLLVGRSGFRPYGLALEQNRRLTGSVYVAGERRIVQSPPDTLMPLNAWVHLAFSYDAASGALRLYVGGVTVAETVLSGGGEVEQLEGRPLTISLPQPVALQERRSWPGRLDEVQLYDRALEPHEVQALASHVDYN